MVRKSQYGMYILTEGVDGKAVSRYDPEANRFKVHLDFIREKWVTVQKLKKGLKQLGVSDAEIKRLIPEMKRELQREVSGW